VVLPGCDEVRLNPSPEPPGSWTAAQREGLGLESRAALEAATRAAWRHALEAPDGDVLWRQSDEAGETLLPSTLVQALLLAQPSAVAGSDPRLVRPLASQPGVPPLPHGDLLPVHRLSASAYDDLRHCPYRFFALRQLGLKDADELEGEVDKRDFGLWLHEVLKCFHEALQAQPQDTPAARQQMIDAAARQVTVSMRLEDGEFLPFSAAWPQVRDGYLQWLTRHEASGARFEQAEVWREQSLGALTLVGKIDRIDRCPDGTTLVMDYKTEAPGKTRERIKLPLEDTQLAFYAALLPDDQLRAAYVNVGEKEGTKSFEQSEVVHVRDALIEGILHDLGQVAQGAALPALGEGVACDFCDARGLCRKDFWEDA
jgi:ATP-dependent helicase/nuclease subunit B